MLFGKKSEKIVLKLEQMELELEEDDGTQPEAETIAERVSPSEELKPRRERKPLPVHPKREVVTHTPQRACCRDSGGQLVSVRRVPCSESGSGEPKIGSCLTQ